VGLRHHARHLPDTGRNLVANMRERLEQQQNAVLAELAEQQKTLDAQRQQFLKRRLELKAKEKTSEGAEKYNAQ
jgi:hypothetical protein